MHAYNGSPDIINNLKLDPDYDLPPIVFGVKMP